MRENWRAIAIMQSAFPPSRCLLQFSLHCLFIVGCPSILLKTVTLLYYEPLSFYPDLTLIIGSPMPRTPPAMAVFLSSFLRLMSSLSPSPTQSARTLLPPRQRRAAPQSCVHLQTCLLPLLHMFMHQRLPPTTLRHRHLKR